MSIEHDFVIRGGTVADGGGGALFEADVAIGDGRIVEIGAVSGRGREEIDARGKLVTPGFVDVHTHYDGQVTWGERLTPSSAHGVTTVLMGNCGVGFSPCKPEDREALIRVMEGVEDIPEAVMAEGLPWSWRTFPDYLNVLAGRRTDIDFAAQLPHAPLRVFVMGERGLNREPASEADMEQMTALVAEAIAEGALGVSTSRNLNHQTKAGVMAPTVTADVEELLALARGLKQAGAGVFQIIPMFETGVDKELDIMRRVVEAAERPLSFTLLRKTGYESEFGKILGFMEQANADGYSVKGQIFPRPVGLLMGLELSMHPLLYYPSYKKIEHLPIEERAAVLRNPEFKAALLAETPEHYNALALKMLTARVDKLYVMGDQPNYEPNPRDSIGARAARRGVTPVEEAYDVMAAGDGRTILFDAVVNYVGDSMKLIEPMLGHPDTLVALGDGGAHYGMICDSSYPTSMLAYWTRDRREGGRIGVEGAIRKLTRDPALAVGLGDRGLLAPGYRADVNVIDYDRLALHRPHIVRDLPTGGKRLDQRADGYEATFVNGALTYRGGEHSGALPGRLVRGARRAPLS